MLTPCQFSDQLSTVRILRHEGLAIAQLEIIWIERGRHGRSHQRKPAARAQARALPDTSRHDELHPLACFEIMPEGHDVAPTARIEHQEIDRAPQVEMVELIGSEAVNGGEYGGGE